MLVETKTLPMQKPGFPWGTLLVAVVILGGITYLSYSTFQKNQIIIKNNTQ